jgi:hypothetical protein
MSSELIKRLEKLEKKRRWDTVVIIPPPLPEAVSWEAIEADTNPPPPVFAL